MTIITLNCVVISIIIIALHFNGKLTTAKAAILAFATQVFNIEPAGNTITALFFVTLYFLLSDLVQIALGKQNAYITKKGAIIAITPVIAYLIAENYYLYNGGILETSGALNYKSFIFYYLKNYLLFLFVVARKISLESSDSIEDILQFCEKIALYSCYLGIVQVLSVYFIPVDSTLSMFIGIKGLSYELAGFQYVRPNAFFAEPKEFAGFLGFIIPYVFLKKRKFKLLLFCMLGVLTLSTTFYVILLLSFIFFVLFRVVASYRVKIIGSIAIILTMVIAISTVSGYLIDSIGGTQDKIIYQLVTNRLADRFSLRWASIDDNRKDFYGIPLQPDLELPVINFMRDYPAVLLLGHGPGNARGVPAEYFKGVWVYNAKLEGKFLGHMNMGWLKYCTELGLISFLLLFILISKCNKSSSLNIFFAFAIAIMFFYRADIILSVLYGVVNHRYLNSNVLPVNSMTNEI